MHLSLVRPWIGQQAQNGESEIKFTIKHKKYYGYFDKSSSD